MKLFLIGIVSMFTGVTTMFSVKNFNVLTLSFWATMVGTAIFCYLSCFGTSALIKKFNKLKMKWNSTGKQIYSSS